MAPTNRLIPFSGMAGVYDIIYDKKNYRREALYLDAIIQRHISTPSATLLDVGCGTGEHLIQFIKKHYRASGIDRSRDMLKQARRKLSEKHISAALVCADARTFELHKTYDVVVSLFHVLSYQTSDDDVVAFFTQIQKHMKSDGICVFDCWYGPGVLHDRPKRLTNTYTRGSATILRRKTPVLDVRSNTVRVTHDVWVSASHEKAKHFSEIHTVRYFFFPEVKAFLSSAGLRICEWGILTKKLLKPRNNTWEVYFVCKKT